MTLPCHGKPPPRREEAPTFSVAYAPPPAASPAGGSRLARALLAALGILCVAMGALGAVLPVLPTTPFLLLAAWCFARSSDSLHRRLHENRFFGEYLRRYRTGEPLPRRTRSIAIALLWLTLGASAAWTWTQRPWLAALLALIGAAVTAHLLLIGRKAAHYD